MKYVQGIWCGSYEYLKTVKVRYGKRLTSGPEQEASPVSVEKLEMSECKGSVSPKLDKACIDGDGKEVSGEQTSRFGSSVVTLLYLSNERTDIQSTIRLLCTKLKSPTALGMRQLKRLLRSVKGTEDMSTVFEMRETAMTEENSWSNDCKSAQTLTGRVIK